MSVSIAKLIAQVEWWFCLKSVQGRKWYTQCTLGQNQRNSTHTASAAGASMALYDKA